MTFFWDGAAVGIALTALYAWLLAPRYRREDKGQIEKISALAAVVIAFLLKGRHQQEYIMIAPGNEPLPSTLSTLNDEVFTRLGWPPVRSLDDALQVIQKRDSSLRERAFALLYIEAVYEMECDRCGRRIPCPPNHANEPKYLAHVKALKLYNTFKIWASLLDG